MRLVEDLLAHGRGSFLIHLAQILLDDLAIDGTRGSLERECEGPSRKTGAISRRQGNGQWLKPRALVLAYT
jgi:hypothetical protein